MRRQLIPALLCVVVFTVLCGLVYPLVTTGVGPDFLVLLGIR